MNGSEAPQTQRFGMKRFLSHPKFDLHVSTKLLPHDIALLELNDTIKFSENGIPTTICLPNFDMDEVKPGIEIDFAGWGKTNVSMMYP